MRMQPTNLGQFGWTPPVFHMMSRMEAAIEPGVTPFETGVEFTAPIAGDSLKRQHDQACSRARAEKLLSQKAATLQKSAPQKHKGPQDTPHTWKKPCPSQPQGSQGGRPFSHP